jgi:hypothetical protein
MVTNPPAAEMVADCIPLIDGLDGKPIISRRDALDIANRILTALGLADGSHVIVPVNPTDEMVAAGRAELKHSRATDVYSAMLLAATQEAKDA